MLDRMTPLQFVLLVIAIVVAGASAIIYLCTSSQFMGSSDPATDEQVQAVILTTSPQRGSPPE